MKNNNITVSFSVAADKYAQYKEICKAHSVTPATDLKHHIFRTIEEDNQNYSGYRLVYCSMCSNKQASELLAYPGTERERMIELAHVCYESNPDAILVTEFTSIKGDLFVETLKTKGWRCYYPEGYDKDKDKRKTCITILAVREDIVFSQEFSKGTELTYRFVKGVLEKDGENPIKVLGIHLPQVDANKPNKEQEFRKDDMFLFAESFIRECQDSKLPGLEFGDFNTELSDEYYGYKHLENINNQFLDTSVDKAPTWNKARLDYCFADPKILNDYEIETEIYENIVDRRLSDHKFMTIYISRKTR